MTTIKNTTGQDMTRSLRLKLREYFSSKPMGSYLTADDVSENWDVDLSYAYRELKKMVSDHEAEEFKAPSRKVNRLVVAYRAVVVEVV